MPKMDSSAGPDLVGNPTLGCVKGAVPQNGCLFAAPEAPRQKNRGPAAPKAPRRKNQPIAAPKAPRENFAKNDPNSFSLAVGPIIELKK